MQLFVFLLVLFRKQPWLLVCLDQLVDSRQVVLVHWRLCTCYVGEVLDRPKAPSRSGAATWVLEDLTQLVGVVSSKHLQHGAGVLALLLV